MIMWRSTVQRTLSFVVLFLFLAQGAWATCGVTDYSGSAGRLYDMSVFVLTCAYYAMTICNAVAAVLSLYGATQIYIKMNTGEDGIAKSMMMLVGGILFLIGASIVLPAFFGVQYGNTGDKMSIFDFFK